MAPPPKPDGARRRRNAESKFTNLAGEPARFRPLPKPPKGRAWTAATKAWWESIWESPMASLIQEADVPALLRGAQLHQDIEDHYSGRVWMVELDGLDSAVAVVRLSVPIAAMKALQDVEDRFGRSPKARQLARIAIDTTAAGSAGGQQRAQVASVRRLRVVDDAVAGA